MLITRRRAFECPAEVYRETHGNPLTQEQVRRYETPNCRADAARHRLD